MRNGQRFYRVFLVYIFAKKQGKLDLVWANKQWAFANSKEAFMIERSNEI